MDRIAPRVVRVRLAPVTGSLRPFLAGQFLFIRFEIPDLPRRTQSFSISNPPGDYFIEILVKGTTDWTLALYDLAEAFPGPRGSQTDLRGKPAGSLDNQLKPQGSQPVLREWTAPQAWLAWVDYPYGGFTCEGAGTGSWVFLAAGLGIAPFLAMAGDRHRDDARILILWSAYNRDELAGFDQLSSINARRSSIRMVPILDHDPMWTGRRGQLDRQALEDLAGRELADPQSRYWISCPAPLRQSLVKALKNLGVSRKRIRFQDCVL